MDNTEKKILLMAAEILNMHGSIVGNRVCQDWSGEPEKMPAHNFTDSELRRLYFNYEQENSDGEDFFEGHYPFGDEMMCSFIFSNALREVAEKI